MKYVLYFLAGVVCPLAVAVIAYWAYFLWGKNIGWPS